MPAISVIIPTHNPNVPRLRATMAGLAAQTLAGSDWEVILVDNRSEPPVDLANLGKLPSPGTRVVAEPRLGLTHARIAGIRSAAGGIIVMVDDDNVLAPGYLSEVARIFSGNPGLGAAGGRSRPVFERTPEPWKSEFFPLLAVRDLGEQPILGGGFTGARREYPPFAPIGAGMAIRREPAVAWADSIGSDPRRGALDRSGGQLVSGGDNDIVMSVLESGLGVGYFPGLSLDHLIPAGRTENLYLGRINHAIQRSWVQVLAIHGACPWPPIKPWTVLPRKLKSFVATRAWHSPRNRIRWKGACGRLEGLSLIGGRDK